jgi:hypothetical protein
MWQRGTPRASHVSFQPSAEKIFSCVKENFIYDQLELENVSPAAELWSPFRFLRPENRVRENGEMKWRLTH